MEAVPASSRFKRMTDEQIVGECKNGDTFAIEYLLREYKSVVLFKSRSYFLHGADRDDMIQEGMIGLFKAIRDFKSSKGCSFRTFSDTCITRQMITAIKSGTDKRQLPIIYAASLSPGGSSEEDEGKPQLEFADRGEGINPEELLIARESVRELRALLRKTLSEFEWNVFVAFAEGKSYQEIAKEVGCKPKKVDNALCRVRRKLNKWRAEQELRERSDIPAPSQNQEIEAHSKASGPSQQGDNDKIQKQKRQSNGKLLTQFELVVLAYYSSDFTVPDIAKALERPVRSVKATLKRVRRKLKNNGPIQGLTPLESEVIYYKLLGFSSPRTAMTLGFPRQTVMRALKDGRRKLRRSIRNHQFSPLT